MRHAWTVGCLLLLAACSNKVTDSAVDLSVQYKDYVPKCLRVTVADAKAPEAHTSSDTLDKAKLAAHQSPQDRTVRIAVFREKDWSQELKIDVASYSTEDCGGTPVETRGLASVTLPEKGSVTPEPIKLLAQDLDGDGYIAESTDSVIQGSDCKDTNPKVYRGAPAVCDGSGSLDVDFNCDGKDDCNGSTCTSDAMCGSGFCVGGVCCNSACNAPPQCRGAGTCGTGTCVYPVTPTVSCNDGNSCTLNDKCDASGTCGGTPKTCNTAPGVCYGSGGTCNASTGACEYPPLPTTTTCDDGNKCTDTDKCNGSGACAGTPRVCNSSPGQCYANSGTCNTTSGACVYAPLPATATCDDAKVCTDADKCDGSGTCAGTPRVCNTPPGQCHASTGTCNTTTGACNYGFLSTTASCNDGLACTSPDKCDGAGACDGTLNCPPPNECKQASLTCSGTGDCQFDVKTSQVGKVCHEASKTGTCLPDGTCQTFPYTVTPNFDPAAIATSSTINDLTISCVATLDSSGATPAWSDSGCNIPRPAISVVGGVVVVAVRNLTVDFPWRLVGTRPVVIAVYGDATLNSEIRANSNRTEVQVGAGSGAGCGAREGRTGTDDGKDSSGGGGGGLATAGGKGGDNDDSSKTGALGGDAAAAGFSPMLSGCAGGDGSSPGNSVAGKGGAGGGSLQLSVAGTLTLKHVVSVSGAGGKGGQPDPAGGKTGGGGGGGSGGMLVLEANSLVIDDAAKLTANGGAGGEGSSDLGGGSLYPGNDGLNGSVTGNSPASGGTDGSVEGGDGGAGAAAGAGPGAGVKGTGSGSVHGSGGGGGGSAGRILLRGVTSCSPTTPGAAIISPAYANTGGVCPLAP